MRVFPARQFQICLPSQTAEHLIKAHLVALDCRVQAFDLFFSDEVPKTLGQGKSADFNSNSGDPRIEIPHHQDFNLDSDLSIAAWVQPIGNIAWDGILAKNPSAESLPNHAGNFELRIQN